MAPLLAAPAVAPAADEVRWTEPRRLIWAEEGALATLADGHGVRLAGIELPGLAAGAPAPLADATHAALAELLDGWEVRLGLGAVARDRHDRLIAQLRRADGVWVQGELLRRGLARVRTSPDERALAADMLAVEEEARAARRGIWGDAAYAVLRDDAAAPFIGSFRIVAGRVVSARTAGRYLYLNFGRDRRGEFAVRVRGDDVRALQRDGLDPEALVGRVVRVRGWLLEAGGPLIELSHPEQIEILD